MVTINRTVRSYNDGLDVIHEREYKGLSTDTKPLACHENSLFLELDTGDIYFFNGDSWFPVGGGAGGDK